MTTFTENAMHAALSTLLMQIDEMGLAGILMRFFTVSQCADREEDQIRFHYLIGRNQIAVAHIFDLKCALWNRDEDADTYKVNEAVIMIEAAMKELGVVEVMIEARGGWVWDHSLYRLEALGVKITTENTMRSMANVPDSMIPLTWKDKKVSTFTFENV